MVFPTRAAKFHSFLAALNEKLLKKYLPLITPKFSYVNPTLND